MLIGGRNACPYLWALLPFPLALPYFRKKDKRRGTPMESETTSNSVWEENASTVIYSRKAVTRVFFDWGVKDWFGGKRFEEVINIALSKPLLSMVLRYYSSIKKRRWMNTRNSNWKSNWAKSNLAGRKLELRLCPFSFCHYSHRGPRLSGTYYILQVEYGRSHFCVVPILTHSFTVQLYMSVRASCSVVFPKEIRSNLDGNFVSGCRHRSKNSSPFLTVSAYLLQPSSSLSILLFRFFISVLPFWLFSPSPYWPIPVWLCSGMGRTTTGGCGLTGRTDAVGSCSTGD